MAFEFYTNLNSENDEIHIYEDGDSVPLCGDADVAKWSNSLVGIFANEKAIVTKFDEDNARVFAAVLENNNLNVCGNCVSTLYRTLSSKSRLICRR